MPEDIFILCQVLLTCNWSRHKRLSCNKILYLLCLEYYSPKSSSLENFTSRKKISPKLFHASNLKTYLILTLAEKHVHTHILEHTHAHTHTHTRTHPHNKHTLKVNICTEIYWHVFTENSSLENFFWSYSEIVYQDKLLTSTKHLPNFNWTTVMSFMSKWTILLFTKN